MAKYTGPVCRLCRREGEKLFLKGDRCFTSKCAIDRRSYPPGEHGQGRKKISEYGLQLREKQKLRQTYGMLERQFLRYYRMAERKRGITGDNLLQLLETRLDNVVYRLGFAVSRAEARQMVLHGHFQVNGKRVNIPSYQLKAGDEVAVREGSREHPVIASLAPELGKRTVPEWLQLNAESLSGSVLELPKREQIDLPIQEHLIVELYSR